MSSSWSSSSSSGSLFDLYIYFILAVKVLFVLMAIAEKLAKDKNTKATLTYWKEKTEFIFIVSMAVLCIGLFNPFRYGQLVLNHHTRILLFIYGFIVLLNADWSSYFPRWVNELNYLKSIVGK